MMMLRGIIMLELLAKNIYRLRKASGLKQEEIADKAGLSRAAYSAIEKGKSNARSETLHRIAEALNVSIRELYMDIPELKSVRFRMSKISEQKKKAREQQIIKIAVWLKDYNFLENELTSKMKNRLVNIKEKEPIKLAAKVREALSIESGEPIRDIYEVVNSAGIRLHLSEMPLSDFFGVSIGEEDGGPAISVNVSKGISLERQIFTVAHEMAHLILHKNSFRPEMFEDDQEEENEANLFASHFLMPEDEFLKALERCKGLHWVDAVLNVKRYFKVSYLTVLRRLIDLNITDSSIYLKFTIESKKMYGFNLKNHNEPAALREPDTSYNNIIVEERLHSLVREAVERDIITISKASEILNISHHDMLDLANSWKEINWNLN